MTSLPYLSRKKTMKSSAIKKIAYGGIALLAGFFANYGVSKTFPDEPETATPTQASRRSASMNKRITEKKSGEKEQIFTERDLKRLIQRLSKNPDAKQVEEEYRLLMQYSHTNKSASSRELTLAMLHLFSYWGRLDPGKACETAMNLEKGPREFLRNILVETALASLLNKDPGAVAAMYNDTETGLFAITGYIHSINTQLTRHSPDQAWAWMKELNVGEQRTSFKSFFETLSVTHPERIEEFVHKLPPPEEWSESGTSDEHDILKVIYSSWAKFDEKAAKKWAYSWPEEWRTGLSYFFENTVSKS